MLIRFGPTTYDDPRETLTKLKQTTYVSAYKSQFEYLSNQLKGLSHKLSCFLSGLKNEIRLHIRTLNHINLNATFGLAKIQEEYLLSARKSIKNLEDKNSMLIAKNKWNREGSNKGIRPTSSPRSISSVQMDEKRMNRLLPL